ELWSQMCERRVEVAHRSGRLTEALERGAERTAPTRVDVSARSAEERTCPLRRGAVPVEVLRVLPYPDAGVMGHQGDPLLLEHRPQPARPRLAAQRRPRNERFADRDGADQMDDLLRRRQPVRPGLPRLDPLAARESQPPLDARLRREP